MENSFCSTHVEPYDPSPCSKFGFKGQPGQVMDITNVVIEPTHPEHPKEPQQLPGEPPPGPWELLFQEWRLALDEKMFHAVRSAFDRSFILIDEEEPIDADQSRILYSLTDRTFLEHYV